MANIETIEIDERLSRYEDKEDIVRNDSEFQNLVDKVLERRIKNEIIRTIKLLVKFGDVRFEKMIVEQNPHKQKGMAKVTMSFYQKAVEIGLDQFDMKQVLKQIEEVSKYL